MILYITVEFKLREDKVYRMDGEMARWQDIIILCSLFIFLVVVQLAKIHQ